MNQVNAPGTGQCDLRYVHCSECLKANCFCGRLRWCKRIWISFCVASPCHNKSLPLCFQMCISLKDCSYSVPSSHSNLLTLRTRKPVHSKWFPLFLEHSGLTFATWTNVSTDNSTRGCNSLVSSVFYHISSPRFIFIFSSRWHSNGPLASAPCCSAASKIITLKVGHGDSD